MVVPVKKLQASQLQSIKDFRRDIDSIIVQDQESGDLGEVVAEIALRVVPVVAMGWQMAAITVATVGVIGLTNYRRAKRRVKFRKSIGRELRDLFDETQDYRMDAASVSAHLHHYGIFDPVPAEIDALYIEVWNQLQGGKLRQICNDRDIAEVARHNEEIVRESRISWKIPP